jgi:biopolymer transport protein TolQ
LFFIFGVSTFLMQAAQNQGISLTDLLLKASPIAKFVLLLLLIFSVVSWAIIFAKWRALQASQKDTREFLERFNHSAKLTDLSVEAEFRKQSPVARIFLAGYAEVTRQIESSPNRMLSLESINRVMQSATIDEVTQMEKSLSWLATAANASPFIGLFGTVVGIIIAFQGLSTASGSSIQSVAPGIAEALIATAAGIAAAVPAAIFYNYFLSKIKTLTSSMDRFSLEMLNLVERYYANEF